MFCQIFPVTGSGQFPVDMLRYDSCYPHSQDSVVALSEKNTRTVVLARAVKRVTDTPTIARWESFGWKVGNRTTYKV